jgi:hypothetical protein
MRMTDFHMPDSGLSPIQQKLYEDELAELTSVDGWKNHLFVAQQVKAARRRLGVENDDD